MRLRMLHPCDFSTNGKRKSWHNSAQNECLHHRTGPSDTGRRDECNDMIHRAPNGVLGAKHDQNLKNESEQNSAKRKIGRNSAPGALPGLRIGLSDTARRAAANGRHPGPKFRPEKIIIFNRSRDGFAPTQASPGPHPGHPPSTHPPTPSFGYGHDHGFQTKTDPQKCLQSETCQS